MRTFDVCVAYSDFIIQVEAENEDKARQIAFEKAKQNEAQPFVADISEVEVE